MISRAKPARSTCSCPHRRASTFRLSACFRGRFALANTSMDCGHRCTDLRSIASNQRYRLLAEWKYRGPCVPSPDILLRQACACCVHASHARSAYDRAEISRRCLISFRVECLRSELNWRKYLLKTVTECRCYIYHICKHINTEVYSNYFFLHKYISQKYNFTRKWVYISWKINSEFA